MIGRVTFASCYVYSPHGSSEVCERSRQLRSLLKAGDARFLLKYAVRVRQQVAEVSPIHGFLHPADVLVPIPGSAPPAAGAPAVAERLAMAFLDAGLGQGIWRGLRRVRAVRKSATASPGTRPTVDRHYQSIAVDAALAVPPQVVLIDDVVTKGRTLLAAAARLQEAGPRTTIRAFALLRTMGFADRVESLLDPCVGEIRWRANDAHRNP